MDITKAALETLGLIEKRVGILNKTRRTDDPTSLNHLCWMLEGIITEYIQHEKAHRWLGWVQACLCKESIATMQELSLLNKES